MQHCKFATLKFHVLGTIGVARIFDWVGPNHKLHAMTSSETSKKEFFVRQKYRRMEDQKQWPLVLARN